MNTGCVLRLRPKCAAAHLLLVHLLLIRILALRIRLVLLVLGVLRILRILRVLISVGITKRVIIVCHKTNHPFL